MTASKHMKQLVRARMAATGEAFSTARRQVLAAEVEVALSDPLEVDVHGRHGQAVTFTPDGTRLLSGGEDARIAVLDAASGRLEGELNGHDKVVNAVATAGRSHVLSVSSDRTVRLWDLDGKQSVAVLEGHRDAVVALDVLPEGTEAVTGGYDGRLMVWDLVDHKARIEVRSGPKRVAALAYTPDQQLIVESGQGPTVYVRDRGSGEVSAKLDSGSPGVIGLAVAPDGSLLATAGYDGRVVLWDCDAWQPVRSIVAGGRVSAVTFSRSGQLLAVAADKRVSIWSHTSDEPVASATLPITGVYGVAISPDARRLAQTGADGKVRIWTLRR